MSWASQLAATASMPIRGSPTSPRSSTTQKLTESRISGSSGRSANTNSRDRSMPPVRSLAIRAMRFLDFRANSPTAGGVDILGEQRSHPVQVDAEGPWVGVRTGFALRGGLGPPTVHPGLEDLTDRQP